MDELFVKYSKKHAPHMPDAYHFETARLMEHMLFITNKQKDLMK